MVSPNISIVAMFVNMAWHLLVTECGAHDHFNTSFNISSQFKQNKK